MSGIEIFSEDLGLILPIKKPIRIKGIIFIINLIIFRSRRRYLNSIPKQSLKKLNAFSNLNYFPNSIIGNGGTI